MNLDEIEVSIETCPVDTLPDAALVGRLVCQLKESVRSLAGRASQKQLERIEHSLSQFVADPKRIDAFFNSGDAIEPGESPLTLRGDRCGTHFLIQPADSFLGAEIDSTKDSEYDPNFIKFLVGFANRMVPAAPTTGATVCSLARHDHFVAFLRKTHILTSLNNWSILHA